MDNTKRHDFGCPFHSSIWNFSRNLKINFELYSTVNMNQGFENDEEEEDEVAVGKIQYWHLTAHVHGKAINVSCGDATQRLKWLAHVAIARWDIENCQGWKRLGIPTVIRAKRKDGEELDMGMTIRDVLQNGDHVFVETSLAPSATS